MQRTALVSMLLVASCGAGSANAPKVDVGPPPAAHAPPVQVALPVGVPHGAPLVLAFDAASAASVFGGLRSELEHELGLPEGALGSNLADFGIDPKRPIVFAFDPLDETQRNLVAELATLGDGGSSTGGATVIDRVAHAELVSAMRVLLPASDRTKLDATIRKLLRQEGWQGERDAFTKGRRVLRITMGESAIAVDMAAGRKADVALAALDRIVRAAQDPAPGLDGSAARASWSPPELAKYVFLENLVTTIGAVSGPSIDAPTRDRIVAQGLHESASVFSLAKTSAGVTFERVDAKARFAPFELVITAKPGPGFTMPPDAAFAPAAFATVPGANAEIGGTRAFAEALGALRSTKPMDLARDAGMMGWLVGLPEVLLTLPSEMGRTGSNAPPPPETLARFERQGHAWTASAERIFVGVLPEKTTRAEAQCALAPAMKCAGGAKLPVGKPAQRGSAWAELLEVDRRFVVLLANDAAALPKTVTLHSAGPVHFEASTSAITPFVGSSVPLPTRVAGDASREGDAAVFRITGL